MPKPSNGAMPPAAKDTAHRAHGLGTDVFTTGQIAEICSVAPRTVSKWFDSGQLHGYRIPGSRDRRVPRLMLVAFMRRHGIPLAGLEERTKKRVLCIGLNGDGDVLASVLNEQPGWSVATAGDAFSAGLVIDRSRPHVVLVDPGTIPDVAGIAASIKDDAELVGTCVLCIGDEPAEAFLERAQGWRIDGYVPRPFRIKDIVERIDEMMSLVH